MMTKNASTFRTLITAAALACSALLGPLNALAQEAFDSPEAAADAFVRAVATSDDDALRIVLGANWKRFIPIDNIDRDDVNAFLAARYKKEKIIRDSDSRAHLAVGPDEWTLPIPIVKSGGAWRFDTRAGAEEIRTRRIGRNELAAMQAALAYYDAQKEYALVDRNGDGILEYAQKLISSPGKKDGLYWDAQNVKEESPLGPLFGNDKPGTDYNGYYFKILKGQGKHAPGGAFDYRIKGRMSAGFALVAWPVRYDETGVMTFIVNYEGQIYEKNLGAQTDAVARKMTLFDPDSSWRKVSP
ncbi:MAG: DUF2950 domain-containing protein [Desulfobacterales bacterium]|jgi:hypothetical protein